MREVSFGVRTIADTGVASQGGPGRRQLTILRTTTGERFENGAAENGIGSEQTHSNGRHGGVRSVSGRISACRLHPGDRREKGTREPIQAIARFLGLDRRYGGC